MFLSWCDFWSSFVWVASVWVDLVVSYSGSADGSLLC